MRVCHDGVNPNKTKFDLRDIERAKSSIVNIPILANVVFDENGVPDFGSHDMSIEEDKMDEGEYRIIYKETPVGICPETNNYEIAEFDGKNYVYVDCLIFKDYTNYTEDIIKRDKNIKISMEAIIDKFTYDNKTGVYQILDFRYKGITLLGKKYGTGMEHAMATIESFSDEISKMSLEAEEEIKKVSGTCNFFKKDEIDKNKSKEDVDLDEKLKLINEYKLSLESLDFEIEKLSLEELKTKLEEFVGSQKEVSDGKEEADFALIGQFIDELVEKLSVEKITAEWDSSYEYPRYSFVDFDNEKSEVYFFDRSDWYLYGAKYEKDGDTALIDFETKKRKKFSIEDFDEGSGVTGNFSLKDVVNVFDNAKEKAISLTNEVAGYKEDFKKLEGKIEELQEFKNNAIKQEREAAETELFEQFDSKLKDVEEYVELKENSKDYTIEELSDKCFAMVGKKEFKFSANKKQNESVKIPLTKEKETETEPYNGLFSKFGFKPNK